MTIQIKKNLFFSGYCLFLSVLITLFISTLIFILPGCKDDNVQNINSSSNDNVSVGFYSENASGDNTLIITEAKFLVRKLMLERENEGEEFDVNLGPFVVYLDMTQKVVIVGIAKIPLGDYDEIMFQVHKPSPNEVVPDPEFHQGNSNHQRFSVIAKGFYNDLPFVYKSHITVVREIDFENPPVTVAANAVVNITVRLNPYSWFINGNTILDPMDEDNSHAIDQNIKNSLRRAFRDINLDGEPD